jgi:hypothetical protein
MKLNLLFLAVAALLGMALAQAPQTPEAPSSTLPEMVTPFMPQSNTGAVATYGAVGGAIVIAVSIAAIYYGVRGYGPRAEGFEPMGSRV